MPIYKMKGKKDGKQKYRVRVNFINNFGKSKQIDRVAYGLEEAKQLERELNYSLKEETPAAKMTINDLYKKYIESKRSEVKESSLDKSIRILELHVLPIMGSVKIDKLTAPKLQDWKLEIEKKGLAITSRQNIYGEFRAMLNYAVRLEYIPKNPLIIVGNFKAPLEIKKEMQYYTPEEFKKFISAVKEYAIQCEKQGDMYKWYFYVFYNIAFYTGMRKGEIYALCWRLQWKHIQNGYICITESLRQRKQGDDQITPPKNKSSIRTIQIPKPLRDILYEHYKRCQAMDGFNDNYFICGGIRAIRNTSVQNVHKKCAEQAGVKVIRIHDFRHSHASLLANEGINIQEVAKRLGHSNVTITWNTYAHLYPREDERAIKILDKIV